MYQVLFKTGYKCNRNEMLKTDFGDNFLSRSQTFNGFKHFKDGEQLLEDDPWSGKFQC